jgi:hypothetical protein
MKKNYKGIIISIGIAILYNILTNNSVGNLSTFLGQTFGVLLIPSIIVLTVYYFSKQPRNYGTLMAWTTLLLCAISFLGHMVSKT